MYCNTVVKRACKAEITGRDHLFEGKVMDGFHVAAKHNNMEKA